MPGPYKGFEPAPGFGGSKVDRIEIETRSRSNLDRCRNWILPSRLGLQDQTGALIPGNTTPVVSVAVESQVQSGTSPNVDKMEGADLGGPDRWEQDGAASDLVGLSEPGLAQLEDSLSMREDEGGEWWPGLVRGPGVLNYGVIEPGEIMVRVAKKEIVNCSKEDVGLWSVLDCSEHRQEFRRVGDEFDKMGIERAVVDELAPMTKPLRRKGQNSARRYAVARESAYSFHL